MTGRTWFAALPPAMPHARAAVAKALHYPVTAALVGFGAWFLHKRASRRKAMADRDEIGGLWLELLGDERENERRRVFHLPFNSIAPSARSTATTAAAPELAQPDANRHAGILPAPPDSLPGEDLAARARLVAMAFGIPTIGPPPPISPSPALGET